MKLSTGAILILLVYVSIVAFVPSHAQQKSERQPIQASECGMVELVFDDSSTAYSRMSFAKEYARPPLVIVSECYTAGSWIIIKTESITKNECTICAVNHNNSPIKYRSKVAYLVFAPEDVRYPPTEFLNLKKPKPKSQTAKKKTPIRTEAQLIEVIDDALGYKKSPSQVKITGTAPQHPVVIRWQISENLTRGMTRDGAIIDIQEMLCAIHKSGFGYATIRFEGTFTLVDVYGRESDSVIIRADYSKRNVAKMNWDNILLENIPEIADAWYEHPDFRK